MWFCRFMVLLDYIWQQQWIPDEILSHFLLRQLSVPQKLVILGNYIKKEKDPKNEDGLKNEDDTGHGILWCRFLDSLMHILGALMDVLGCSYGCPDGCSQMLGCMLLDVWMQVPRFSNVDSISTYLVSRYQKVRIICGNRTCPSSRSLFSKDQTSWQSLWDTMPNTSQYNR